MTCLGDPGDAIGIVSDSDGAILEALRSKYFVPVVLFDSAAEYLGKDVMFLHELKVFIIAADSESEAMESMNKLRGTKWWNQYANFIFIDPNPELHRQCTRFRVYLNVQIVHSLLNTQFICGRSTSEASIVTYNQFRCQAPPVWKFVERREIPGFGTFQCVFFRDYRKGGQTCEQLNFPKTIDIGGWPVFFLTDMSAQAYSFDFSHFPYPQRILYAALIREENWFMDNIVKPLNATAVIAFKGNVPERYRRFDSGIMAITVTPHFLGENTERIKVATRKLIIPLYDAPMYAMTKHTGHKTQLEKILTVIDGNSRIGMLIVYLITFLFFKYFLGQTVMSALLNLMRLTCNTGLPNLPNNLAPTLYLSCLLMFVVTLQGIYTGNLATLLTTTIPYRNVQIMQDIPDLGYTIYTKAFDKVLGHPSLEGRAFNMRLGESCADYVLTIPLAACVERMVDGMVSAIEYNLHVSRDAILYDYPTHILEGRNPLGRRIVSITRRWVEHGLYFKDQDLENLRLQLVDDDDMKRNADRRVMNLNDLGFAFVILGVGLLCASVCFIGELVVYKIRLKMAKRRNRVRPRLAWGVEDNYFLSFRSLNFRCNPRRLFSRHRSTRIFVCERQ